MRSDSKNWRISGDTAFCEFRDSGPRGKDAFIIDVKDAINASKFGPAWDDFMECLINGALFAIITARGHESDSMRSGVEYIIDNVLSNEQKQEMYNQLLKFAYKFKDTEVDSYDRILRGVASDNPLFKIYLDNCDFVGISSPSRGGSPDNPEKAKEDALLDFKSKVNNFAGMLGVSAKIGFSDDDVKNVNHIEELAKTLHSERFPNIIEFVVKNTNVPNNVTKTIRRFESFSKFVESQDPLASSTLSCTAPNAACGLALILASAVRYCCCFPVPRALPMSALVQ